MVKIAAVCAYASVFNNGMVSVDLALHSMLERSGLDVELDVFTPLGPHVIPAGRPSFPGLEYKWLSAADELEGYDAVLFWGDFLHSRQYHLQDAVAVLRRRMRDASPDELTNHLFRTLLLEGAPDALLNKTICFGGSIYLNTAEDELDARYHAAISRLYEQARLVQLRDPVSAAFAQSYGAPGPTLGSDCSWLLQPFGGLDWKARATPAGDKPRIGYSFGRLLSLAPPSRRSMVGLVERLADEMGADRVNVAWLDQRSEPTVNGFLGKLELIRSCDLIVTDTYHCALNAWREGVPTVCIGKGAAHPKATVSEKKKELVFNMLNARDFFVFIEQLEDWRGFEESVENLLPIIQGGRRAEAVKITLHRHAKVAEARLLAALRDLLPGGASPTRRRLETADA